jgi:hypothetical protein
MSMHVGIVTVAVVCLLSGVFALVAGGSAAMPTAMTFVIISILASAVDNALRQLEARLKALEERLAKCERISQSAT